MVLVAGNAMLPVPLPNRIWENGVAEHLARCEGREAFSGDDGAVEAPGQ